MEEGKKEWASRKGSDGAQRADTNQCSRGSIIGSQPRDPLDSEPRRPVLWLQLSE